MFFEFCKFRHAEESLRFWLHVEVFQNQGWKPFKILVESAGILSKGANDALLQSEAMQIFETYVEESAPHQICLNHGLFENLSKKIESKKFDRMMFREAQRYIFRDLEKGTFNGFLHSCREAELLFLEKALKKISNNAPGLATMNALLRMRKMLRQESNLQSKTRNNKGRRNTETSVYRSMEVPNMSNSKCVSMKEASSKFDHTV